MHASVTLGRVAGVEIGLNWSWLVIVGLLVWSLGAAVFPEEVPGLSDAAYFAMAAGAAVLFFVCLLLHELGHAVVARREGMEIDGITLWLFGGVARFKGLFPSARAELRIALAGPVVSVLLGAGLLGLAEAVPLPGAVDAVARWLGAINLVLVAFNMLPALPLDGGRVLRALLWRSSGDFARATRTAGALGRAFGQGMIGLGIVLAFLAASPGGLWLALIGLFLVGAAEAEVSLATIRLALKGLYVADAMVSEPVCVEADTLVSDFVDRDFARSRHAAYPVVIAGWPVGLIAFRDIAAVPAARWSHTTVGDLAIPLAEAPVADPRDELGDAAIMLSETSLRRALVVDGERLAGLLSITDVSRLIELQKHRGVQATRHS